MSGVKGLTTKKYKGVFFFSLLENDAVVSTPNTSELFCLSQALQLYTLLHNCNDHIFHLFMSRQFNI